MNASAGVIRRVTCHQRLAFSTIIVAVALLVSGCHTGSIRCTLEARFSLVVTVVDASGKRVCDASVTADDGAFSAALPAGPGVGCAYFGVSERKGTYAIKVRNGTKTTTLDGVKVSADACHVHTRHVTVVLTH